MISEALLSRDAAFYLINAPVVDLEADKKISMAKRWAFALKFIDPFILYEKLYCDPTVPFPFVESGLSRLWKSKYHSFCYGKTKYKTELFDENQLSFYKELSGIVEPLKVEDAEIKSLIEESMKLLDDVVEYVPLKTIEKEFKKLIFDPFELEESEEGISVIKDEDKLSLIKELRTGKEYLSIPIHPLVLNESSFFWHNTSAFLEDFWGKSESTFLKGIYREPIIAWIFSSILCCSLQQLLDLPGLYSAVSFSGLKLFPTVFKGTYLKHAERLNLGKKVLAGMRELYEYGPGRELKIRVPSFSAWAGDKWIKGAESNTEILKRAIDIRENKYVSDFRRKLWTIVDEVIRESDNAETTEGAQEILDRSMRDLYKELRDNLRPKGWLERLRETTITAILSVPLPFIPFSGIITGTFFDSIKAYKDKKRNGWIYFLYDEIGYA